jgi:hypothetical protein
VFAAKDVDLMPNQIVQIEIGSKHIVLDKAIEGDILFSDAMLHKYLLDFWPGRFNPGQFFFDHRQV